jgi:hypothetical protein
MLMSICIQVVQTNNNESNWRERKQDFLMYTSKRYENSPSKHKTLIFKNLLDKIHKLIV